MFGLTFGPIQVRFSEALCLLPFLFPETAWGLGVGCLIANLFSPYGALDIVVGSLSTLIAALLTARCRSPWTAALPPVVCNMVLVGAVCGLMYYVRKRYPGKRKVGGTMDTVISALLILFCVVYVGMGAMALVAMNK